MLYNGWKSQYVGNWLARWRPIISKRFSSLFIWFSDESYVKLWTGHSTHLSHVIMESSQVLWFFQTSYWKTYHTSSFIEVQVVLTPYSACQDSAGVYLSVNFPLKLQIYWLVIKWSVNTTGRNPLASAADCFSTVTAMDLTPSPHRTDYPLKGH